MCGIILDTAHVFVCSSIVDVFVDALTGDIVGEIVSEIAAYSLVYFLVMIMPWPMVVAGVPITSVMMSHFATVVVLRVIAAMCARSW